MMSAIQKNEVTQLLKVVFELILDEVKRLGSELGGNIPSGQYNRHGDPKVEEYLAHLNRSSEHKKIRDMQK